MARQPLSRTAILDAALGFVTAHGLAGLTMRKLAAELGVEAMSLYNHVANKADLLDGITARVLESVPLPDPADPWDRRLRALATATHAALCAHPAVAAAMAAGTANPRSLGALRRIDAILAALLDAGLSDYDAARRYRSLFGLILGSALTAAPDPAPDSAVASRTEPVGEWFRRNTTAETLPSLHRTLPALLDIDCTPPFAGELEFFLATLTR